LVDSAESWTTRQVISLLIWYVSLTGPPCLRVRTGVFQICMKSRIVQAYHKTVSECFRADEIHLRHARASHFIDWPYILQMQNNFVQRIYVAVSRWGGPELISDCPSCIDCSKSARLERRKLYGMDCTLTQVPAKQRQVMFVSIVHFFHGCENSKVEKFQHENASISTLLWRHCSLKS